MVNSTKILPSEVQFLFGREREKQIYNMSENEGKKEKWNENGGKLPPPSKFCSPSCYDSSIQSFQIFILIYSVVFSSEILQCSESCLSLYLLLTISLYWACFTQTVNLLRVVLDQPWIATVGLHAAQTKQLRDTCWPLWQHCHFRIGTTFLKLPFPKTLE